MWATMPHCHEISSCHDDFMTSSYRRLSARLFIVCGLLLCVTSARANCLETLTVGAHPAANQAELAALIHEAASKCKSDPTDFLYSSLSRFLQKSSDEIQADAKAGGEAAEYDVIIVGGGISGGAAAMAIDPRYRVLVIDKYAERTSVFGNTAGYQVRVPSNFIGWPVQIGEIAEGGEAATRVPFNTGKNVLINLFYSGARVLLDARVLDVHSITMHAASAHAGAGHGAPRYVVVSNRGSYFSRYVIVATGYQGVNLSHFDPATRAFLAAELKKPDSQVRTAESFFELCAKGPCAQAFAGKAVAIVGRGASGREINALLEDGGAPPRSIETFTSMAAVGSRPLGAPGPMTPGVFLPDSGVHYWQVASGIDSMDDGKFQIKTGAGQVIVDEIILATGYSIHLPPLFSERTTFKRILRNTASLFRDSVGTGLDPEDPHDTYRFPPLGEPPEVDLLAIGAAASGKRTFVFALVINLEGQTAGEAVAKDLAISGNLGSVPLMRKKIERRIEFLLSLRK